MILNCGVGEDSWESLGLQGDPTSPEYLLVGLMLKLKLQYFGHLMRRADSLEKILVLGKIWGQEEKKVTKDEVVGWHHWLNGHEFEQASVVGDGQGGWACCSPWGCKELDMTEQLNWTEGAFHTHIISFIITKVFCAIVPHLTEDKMKNHADYLIVHITEVDSNMNNVKFQMVAYISFSYLCFLCFSILPPGSKILFYF